MNPYCDKCGMFTTHCICELVEVECPNCGWVAFRPSTDIRCYGRCTWSHIDTKPCNVISKMVWKLQEEVK